MKSVALETDCYEKEDTPQNQSAPSSTRMSRFVANDADNVGDETERPVGLRPDLKSGPSPAYT